MRFDWRDHWQWLHFLLVTLGNNLVRFILQPCQHDYGCVQTVGHVFKSTPTNEPRFTAPVHRAIQSYGRHRKPAPPHAQCRWSRRPRPHDRNVTMMIAWAHKVRTPRCLDMEMILPHRYLVNNGHLPTTRRTASCRVQSHMILLLISINIFIHLLRSTSHYFTLSHLG